MSFVQSQSLKELTCHDCGKYLSYFPIYYQPDEGSFCGRCPKPNGANVIRNEIYENLAELQKFPCSHTSDGCTENLIPSKIPQHEKFCIFRKCNCPISCYGNCEWRGFRKDLLDHFEDAHPVFLLKDTQFELDFVNSHKENYLLVYGEELFVITRTNDSKTNVYTISLEYIGNNAHAENYLYRVILENGCKTLRHEITNKLKDEMNINGECIRSILEDPVSVIAHIEILEDKTEEVEEEIFSEAVNYDLLRELECFVCMEYMMPPIHQCITGHSICFKCKSQVAQCPNCKKEFKDTQNYALAQIINYLTYPCKYPKCRFTASGTEIRQHQSTCVYGPFKCPLSEYEGCNIEVPFKEIEDHLINSHYENLLETDIVSLPFEDGIYDADEDCRILKYGFKLFKLHYRYRENRFYWAMQLIGPEDESSKYKFDIDVIDNSASNNRAYFRSFCSGLTDKATAFDGNKSHIYIDYAQIKTMITNEFSYRVRVLKD